MKAFDVYKFNRKTGKLEKIDTVFYDDDFTSEEVKRSLVNHDGYSEDITVRKGR